MEDVDALLLLARVPAEDAKMVAVGCQDDLSEKVILHWHVYMSCYIGSP